jgi:hypothetical protein
VYLEGEERYRTAPHIAKQTGVPLDEVRKVLLKLEQAGGLGTVSDDITSYYRLARGKEKASA